MKALEDVLVAICPLGRDEPVGAGLLVEPDLVLTCAHVVNAAIDRPLAHSDNPSKARVWVRLHVYGNPPVAGFVDTAIDAWRAPPPSRRPGADLCLLRLEAAIVGEFEPVPMNDVRQTHLPAPYRAVGFPRGWDFDISTGEIQGRDPVNLYLLRPSPGTAAKIHFDLNNEFFRGERRPPGLIGSGFSGAPVAVNGAIVGLIAEARGSMSDVTAYMIPAFEFPSVIAARITSAMDPIADKTKLDERTTNGVRSPGELAEWSLFHVPGTSFELLEGLAGTRQNANGHHKSLFPLSTTVILGDSNKMPPYNKSPHTIARWRIPITSHNHRSTETAYLIIGCMRHFGGLHSPIKNDFVEVSFNDLPLDGFEIRIQPMGHTDYFHQRPLPPIPMLPPFDRCLNFYAWPIVDATCLIGCGIATVVIKIAQRTKWDIDYVGVIQRVGANR